MSDVKRESVFETSGTQRNDFLRTLQEENEVAEIEKIIWLSGKKGYGSMAIYLATHADAEALLSGRIVHVRGEAAFATGSMSDSDRCVGANVNSITTRKSGAQDPRLAVSALAIIVSSSAHLIYPNVLPVRATTLSMAVTARNGTKRGKLSVGGSRRYQPDGGHRLFTP